MSSATIQTRRLHLEKIRKHAFVTLTQYSITYYKWIYVSWYMLRRAFNWKDPLFLRKLLTKDECMIQESAHKFCQDVLMPAVKENHRHETFDKSIIRQMGAWDFLECRWDIIATV